MKNFVSTLFFDVCFFSCDPPSQVGACGFDSIPADMGQVKKWLQSWWIIRLRNLEFKDRLYNVMKVCVKKEMGGDVNSVETYLR